MRHVIAIAFVAATVLAGCHSPSMGHTQTATSAVPARPLFHPMLINTLGTRTTPDGAWRIEVSDTSLDLSRSHAYSDGQGSNGSGWTTTRIVAPTAETAGWTPQANWFVFVESQNNVWAYDGDRMLILETITSTGNNSKGATYYSRFPCGVPTEVFSRLSEPTRKAVTLGNQ